MPARTPFTTEEVERIKESYEMGWSCEEIAESLNYVCCYRTINDWLKKLGMKRRKNNVGHDSRKHKKKLILL